MKQILRAQKRIPITRFGGFTGDWQRTSAKDVFSLFNGYAFSSKDAQDEGCRWIKIADVGILFMKSGNPSFLPLKFVNKYSRFLLIEGDYVVALTRPILNGELKIAAIDKDHANSLLNQRVAKLVTTNVAGFVYYVLQRRRLVFQIDARISGTDPPNLAPIDIATLPIDLPTLPEQRKIADFLTAVDARIGQLSQKKALLEDYKKGVMQQLFSQAIRFKDDDGNEYPDWEEKKFYELLDSVLDFRGRTPLKLGMDWGGGNVKSLSANNVKNGYIDFAAECNLGSDELFDRWMGSVNLIKGDIVFTMEAPLGNALMLPDNQKYILSQRVVAFKTKKVVLQGFLLQLIWSAGFQSQLARLASGSTAKGINQKSLKKVVVSVPSPSEQTKIANFLSAIDCKIESVDCQIAETKTFKKGLLQQMFV